MSNQSGPILFLALLLLETGNESFADTQQLQLHVYDYAALDPKTLERCMSHMQQILGNAGVSLAVTICRTDVATSCQRGTDTARFLNLRILPNPAKKIKNLSRPPLGQSFANDEGGGYATVFLPVVRSEAQAANVPWTVVLVYAVAHELGHLLLGSNAHMPKGLMKANWERNDYEAMSQNHLHFTHEQALLLARKCGNGGSISSVALGSR